MHELSSPDSEVIHDLNSGTNNLKLVDQTDYGGHVPGHMLLGQEIDYSGATGR